MDRVDAESTLENDIEYGADSSVTSDHTIFSRRNFLRAGVATLLSSTTIPAYARGRRRGFFQRPQQREQPKNTEMINTQYNHKFYPYSRSALEMYLEEEKRLFPEADTRGIQLIADTYANNAAMRTVNIVSKLTGRRLNRSLAMQMVRKDPVMLLGYFRAWADELTEGGCGYKAGALYAQGTDRNRKQFRHLDCDMYSYLVLHGAAIDDIPITAHRRPRHLYLGSTQHPWMAIEMTHQNQPRTRPYPIQDHNPKLFLPEGYLCTHDSELHGVYPEHIKEWRYDLPLPESDIKPSAVGNLLFEKLDFTKDSLQEKKLSACEDMCDLAEREFAAQKFDITLVNVLAESHAFAGSAWEEFAEQFPGVGDRVHRHFGRERELRNAYTMAFQSQENEPMPPPPPNEHGAPT